MRAALSVIARQGFDRTTVRDIAREADAAVGSVNYYFSTKDQLLAAAFEASETHAHARLDEIVAAALPAREKLARLVTLCFPDDSPDDPQWAIEMEVWQQAARHAKFKELFARGNRAWVERIAAMLEQGVAAGELDADLDVRAEACTIAAMIDGLGIYTRITGHVAACDARDLVVRHLDSLTA